MGISLTTVFLTKEQLLFVFQSPSHVISQKMTSLEQLICQRDVLQGGKFSFPTGETHFTQECVRGDSGHLQIQQKVKSLSRVRVFGIPWSAASHAPLSMGFSRQEYWSELPFPSPGESSRTQGLNPGLLHCRQMLYPPSHSQSPEARPAMLWYLCERGEQEMGGGAKNWNGAARWLGHTSQRRGARIGVSWCLR